MNIKDITVLFWDNQDNFALPDTQIQLGIIDGKSERYKDVKRFYSSSEFNTILSNFSESDLILIVCHVDYKNEYKGFKKFETFLNNYSNLNNKAIYVSSNKDAHKDFIDKQTQKIAIYTYSELTEKLKAETINPCKTHDITNSDIPFEIVQDNLMSSIKNTHYDYAIIAALYEDEFEQLKTVFDFPQDKEIKMQLKTRGDYFVYYEGHLKSNKSKKAIVAVQRKTGMIDASIVATQMLEMFSPKYLLMSGVCGGGSDNKYGNVIVANEVFTFQKGKISDITKKDETGKNIKIQLFDKDNNEVDYDHLYDEEGNQIKISVEKFDKEPDPIDLKTHIIDKITEKKIEIEAEINTVIKKTTFLNTTIEVKIEPIACSTMVINKDDFFEDTIRAINRKTAAVEMESYGVARACHFANGGDTIPIIFKSVMDFTKGKKDTVNDINVKAFAAWTSAQFIKCLFELDII